MNIKRKGGKVHVPYIELSKPKDNLYLCTTTYCGLIYGEPASHEWGVDINTDKYEASNDPVTCKNCKRTIK